MKLSMMWSGVGRVGVRSDGTCKELNFLAFVSIGHSDGVGCTVVGNFSSFF